MKSIYRTSKPLTRTLRVYYPPGRGRMVLRTEQDWEKSIEPISVTEDGACSTFSLSCRQPFVYFKPCLVEGETLHWAKGTNALLLMSEPDARPCYPFFFAEEKGRASELFVLASAILGRDHRFRAYLPPGYAENTLASFPVTFVFDGQNLFFPEEAFMGQDWQLDETSETLHAMSAVEDRVVVGIYSADRFVDFTKPGYEIYARALVEEVVPAVESHARVVKSRRFRSVLGSSLGGVIAFYCAWQYPSVFVSAACMSSTFSYKDDLMERVLSEPAPDVAFYLDSGWPGDNYEVTAAMAMALISRGWIYGHDLFYLTFPKEEHTESAWGTRLHLPFQLSHGAVARYSRMKNPVLKDAPPAR